MTKLFFMPIRNKVARSGPLVVALLLGITLIISAWLSYRSALRLSTTLVRGQADALFAAFRNRLPLRTGYVDQGLLDEVFQAGEPQGLRFIGIVSLEGDVLLGAGTSLGRLSAPGALPRDGDVLKLGERRRIIFPAPPSDHIMLPGRKPPPDRDCPSGQCPDERDVPSYPHPHFPRRPPGLGPGPEPPFPPPRPERDPRMIVVEFEPTGSQNLLADATRNLAISATAAVALMIVALVLYRLAVSARDMEERLSHQRHLASLGEMSAVLAHEIRNPLAALKGHAQLLLEQLGESSREHKRAERVVKEAVRLELLTNELLDFARSGKVARVDTVPSELITEVAQSLGESHFSLDLKDAPAHFKLDPIRMRQVVTNLFSNALMASPPDVPVGVHLKSDQSGLSLVIHDGGTGIPPGQEEKIFEAFHTTRVHGTGLGLAVARRIVELHGGTISAKNHPSGGAQFLVRIPPG